MRSSFRIFETSLAIAIKIEVMCCPFKAVSTPLEFDNLERKMPHLSICNLDKIESLNFGRRVLGNGRAEYEVDYTTG